MKKNLFLSFLLILVGLAIILLQVKTYMLSVVGKDATATISESYFREGYDDNGGREGSLSIHYTFHVDGKEQTGSYTYNFHNKDFLNSSGLRLQKLISDTQKGSTIRIKYLSAYPQISGPVATAQAGLGPNLLRIGMCLLGLLLVYIGIKPSKKNKTTAAVSESVSPASTPMVNTPVGYTPAQTVNTPAQTYTAPAQAYTAPAQPVRMEPIAPQTPVVQEKEVPNFCSHCGTALEADWAFCMNCGKKL